jgi:hypothetical protein
MKKIGPLSKPTPFNKSRIPEPKIPAKPVPEPKKPTTDEGKPLQNPSVVDSPSALPTPKRMDDSNAIKNDALFSLNVDAKAIIIKAAKTIKEFTKILLT